MKRNKSFAVSLAVAILIGFSCASYAASLAKQNSPDQKPEKIKLPGSANSPLLERIQILFLAFTDLDGLITFRLD